MKFIWFMWKWKVSYCNCIISCYISLMMWYAWLRLMNWFQLPWLLCKFHRNYGISWWLMWIGENPRGKVMFEMSYRCVMMFEVVRPLLYVKFLRKNAQNQGWNWIPGELRSDQWNFQLDQSLHETQFRWLIKTSWKFSWTRGYRSDRRCD